MQKNFILECNKIMKTTEKFRKTKKWPQSSRALNLPKIKDFFSKKRLFQLTFQAMHQNEIIMRL